MKSITLVGFQNSFCSIVHGECFIVTAVTCICHCSLHQDVDNWTFIRFCALSRGKMHSSNACNGIWQLCLYSNVQFKTTDCCQFEAIMANSNEKQSGNSHACAKHSNRSRVQIRGLEHDQRASNEYGKGLPMENMSCVPHTVSLVAVCLFCTQIAQSVKL